MEISISASYFGKEFNETTIRENIYKVHERMKVFFKNKTYSQLVDRLQIDLFCHMPLIKPISRPRYIEESIGKIVTTGDTFPIHHELYVDIVIENFDELIAAKEAEVAFIIGREVIAYFEKVKLPMKIRKSFDKERFVDDLRDFFNIPESQ